MKLKTLFLGVLALSPCVAFAHPGHSTSPLHLHVGLPNALNAINPAVVAAGLFVGSLLVASRLFKSR
jgi:hypothetical protein